MSSSTELPQGNIAKNYFHIRITKINGEIVYKFDLTEDKVNKIANSYNEDKGFMFQGDEWIYPSKDVQYIGIRMTPYDSQKTVQIERATRGFVGIIGSKEDFIFENGSPVTEDFITRDYHSERQDKERHDKDENNSIENKKKIFIVHGHDENAKNELTVILVEMGFKVTALKEAPDLGMTIIEKLEHYSRDIGFAIILLTPDDYGGLDTNSLKPRARQNVILELGYFMALLERKNMLCLIRTKEKEAPIEKPSDVLGIVTHTFKEKVRERYEVLFKL